MYIITIDGPAASGKSTVAKMVAEKLNITHVNSGEAYRALALYMLENNISSNDIDNINNALKNNSFEFRFDDGKQKVFINNKDVTSQLHTNEINAIVAKYAKIPEVIYKSSDMVRDIVKQCSVVMDGRNLGSFCFPDAEYKFYVDCDPMVRAERRFKEMKEMGSDVELQVIYQQTIDRDELDKTREIAPLVVPENSVMIDSSYKTPDEVTKIIMDIVLNNEKNKNS